MQNTGEALQQDYLRLMAQATAVPGVQAALDVMTAAQEPLAANHRAAYATMFIAPVSVGNHTYIR